MANISRRLQFSLLPLLLLAWISNGFTQTAAPGITTELQSYRDNLYALETANGNNSPQLVETLEQIADRLMRLDEGAEAYAALDRAQQIIRINEGLFTTSQYQFLQKKIEYSANAGDWRNGRKLQDHLFWLYTRKNPNPDESTIADLLKAADMHLRGVVEDEAEYQSYHYRNAAVHSRTALAVAQAIWPPQDPRLGQLIYTQIKHNYLQAQSFLRGSSTRRAPRPGANGDYLALNRGLAGKIYRGNGYLNLERLRQLYLNRDNSDLEAAAMATLYRADWQVLFQQRDLAVVTYAEAYAELLAAGVAEQMVNALFLEPSLIPAVEFYPTVSAALASRGQEAQALLPPLSPALIRLSFSEISAQASPSNVSDSSLIRGFTDPGVALFSFTLDGTEEIRAGRWPLRQLSSIGVAHNLQRIQAEATASDHQDSTINKLSLLRFRPKLVNGIPAAVSGVISYLAISE